MQAKSLIAVLTVLLAGLLAPLQAQTPSASDNSYLVQYIQTSLSAPGRIVRFTDVTGVLSAQARIGEITVADAEGIWLRVHNARINWTRSALLTGHLQVNALQADRIEVLRRPLKQPSAVTAEAISFSFPELPVSVNIAGIKVAALSLGKGVAGVAATLSATGALRIDSAGVSVNLRAKRLDGPGGTFVAALDYARSDQVLNVDLSAKEPQQGLLVNALGIKGRPAVSAKISGNGKLADMRIDLSVIVGSDPLVSGRVTLLRTALGQTFDAAMNGRIASLVPTAYRSFFAGSSTFRARGLVDRNHALDMRLLVIDAANLHLTGSARLSPDGFPQQFSLKGILGKNTGNRVTLPLAGGAVSLNSAQLTASFGQAGTDLWSVKFTAFDVKTPGLSAKKLSGVLAGHARGLDAPDTRKISARMTLAADGLTGGQPDVATALGAKLVAQGDWAWATGQPVSITGLSIVGDTIDLTADGTLALDGFTGKLAATLGNLKAFKALMPTRVLSGDLAFGFNGRLNPVNGQVDGRVTLNGRDIAMGDTRLNRFLSGPISASAHVRRDATGITVQGLTFDSEQAQASGAGFLSAAVMQFNLNASLTDLGLLLPSLKGPAALNITGDGTPQLLPLTADFSAQSGISAKIEGTWGKTLNLRATTTNLPLAVVNTFMPDLGLAGRLSGDFGLTGGRAAPVIRFDLDGSGINAAALLKFQLGNLDIKAKGTYRKGVVYLGRATARSATGMTLDAAGQVDLSGNMIDLRAKGAAPLLPVNMVLNDPSITINGRSRFDLHATGGLSSPSLNGWIDLEAASLALPDLAVRLEGINTRITLSGQTASVNGAKAQVAGGGSITVSGQVGFDPRQPVDMRVDLQSVRYRDGGFLGTTVNGQVVVKGGLTSGLELTGEIRPIETNIALNTVIAATKILVAITHENTPSGVRSTLARAGLTKTQNPTAPKLSLNLIINAPRRIFVRGRGLDAELGGKITLSGHLNDIAASGQFELLRGRLDFLNRRLDLTKGELTFVGSMDPVINFSSQTTADGLAIVLNLSGLASTPDLVLTSTPSLPQDEILAKLIFGRDLTHLSPFQIASLASAVADLSGRSGSGLVEKLRQSTGLDNLDVRTNDLGEISGVAGKYLNENTYSEVEIGSNGTAKATLNLDVTKTLKIQGNVDNAGDTGIGLFFQKDY